MRHIVQLWMSIAVFLSFSIICFAQGATRSAVVNRDFSRLPDSEPTIQYHVYDNSLVTFSTSAQYVLVPVVVSDKSGRPVSGLGKQDFRVKENGKEQQITTVDEFMPALSQSKNDPQPASANAPKQLIIIALDAVNTPVGDQSRSRSQLAEYFKDNTDPNSLYELVSIENNGVRILHDFKEDNGTLTAALDTLQNKFPTTSRVEKWLLYRPSPMDVGGSIAGRPGNANPLQRAEQAYAQHMQAAAISSTLLSFQEIAQFVKSIPGRKSLIWITAGFPFSIEPDTGAVSVGVPSEAYEQTMHLLSSEMISVYSVDAQGLTNRPHQILDTMRIFSAMTGGRAFLNTNDIRDSVKEAVNDGSAYYLLSYPLDKANQRQGWRKISVKAGNYRVHSRTGYLVTKAIADSQNF